MKQSTKLLSLVLALIMAFSCMTVIGNAALVKAEIAWDSLDDAALAPEQVAELALDLVDNDLLAGMEPMDLSILGELDLSSVDNALWSIVKLRRKTIVWGIGSGLIGDIGDLNFDPLKKSGSWTGFLVDGDAEPYVRADGDLKVINQLLEFLGSNSSILGKVAYGIGTSNGISLGLIANFLDLGSLGDDLANIPLMLTEMVYDLLVYGSYNDAYDNDSYPSLEDNNDTLPTDMDSLNEIVDNSLLNLLINPQSYTWEGEGDTAVKNWDSAVILPSVKAWVEAYGRDAAIGYISPRSNSLFGILDILAQFAIDDIAINALNNNLKKTLMEAVEIELNEIEVNTLPGYVTEDEYKADSTALKDVAKDFEVHAEDGEESYVSFIAYDRMKEYSGSYYYTTMESEPLDADEDGEQDTDPESGEALTHKVRKYYKANMASGNKFAKLINWDWEFVGSAYYDVTTDSNGVVTAATVKSTYENQDAVPLCYDLIKKDYGKTASEQGDGTKSIVEGINDLIALVYDVALKDTVKADFEAQMGTGYVPGGNYNFMTNINNIVKYILVNYGELVFGSTSPYAKLELENIKNMTTLELVAMIGPGFFEDAMPQLIIPKNADGTYAFDPGVQLFEFGALVIREFVTDIAPNVNYDQYIFAEKTVTSANDRKFATLDADQWTNLIINMGMDIAYTYLYNISNFGDTITYYDGGLYTAGSPSVEITPRDGSYPAVTSTNAYDETRWPAMLDNVIMWCVRYVGGMESTSVLNGFDADTIEAITGEGSASPLNKLSYILNSLLPLGMVNGYSSTTTYNNVVFDFDVESFFENGLKSFFKECDLSLVLGLLGRNIASNYNPLNDTSLATALLDLVNDILNLVFRTTILQGVNVTTEIGVQDIDAVVSQASLKQTIINLINGLNASKSAILLNALPVVGKLIKGWGTEQSFNKPVISLSRSVDLTAGATTEAQTVAIRNASDGVWRHYKDTAGTDHTDEQYKILVTDVHAFDGMDEDTNNSSQYVTVDFTADTTPTDYGKSKTFTYTAANVPTTGALVRFVVKYKVYNEDGVAMSNGKEFVEQAYTWLNYAPTNANQTIDNSSELVHTQIYTPQYVGLSNATEVIPTLSTSYFGRDYKFCTSSQTGAITNNSGTVDGLNFATVTMTFANVDGGRYFRNIQNFKTYTIQATNEDGEEQSGSGNALNVTGSVDAAAWEAANKTSGSSSNWDIAMKDKDATENHTFSIIYYDDIYSQKLTTLASNEMDAMRLASTYNLNGTYYAGRLLTTQNTTDEEGETVFRETNSALTAWIDDEENVYDASAVTVNYTEYAEDGEITAVEEGDKYVVAKSGTVTTADGKVDVKLVTAIDGTAAINAYVAAFQPGICGGMQVFNEYSVYNFKELYEALYVASNDVAYCKKPTEQLVAEGNGDNIDEAVNTLKTNLKTIEAATTDQRNYTDYKMWRLNRLNDAREDARYFIDLKKDYERNKAGYQTVDSTFPYTWIEEDDLKAVVKNNAALQIKGGTDAQAGTDTEYIVTALLEKMEGEELESRINWLEDRALEYQSQALLDVEIASSYLTKMNERLLPKYTSVIDTYLRAEIDSINNMIGSPFILDEDEYITGDNTALAANYTTRSWTKFANAYEHALNLYYDEADVPKTQKNVFDAKYELMCARNELVLVDDTADYSELEELIAQATLALSHTELYNNTAEELGMVLAELGVEGDITHPDGYTVNLFPGSALYVNKEPYSVDQQEEIDDAATALKEALARLKFKDTIVTRVDSTVIEDVTVKEADVENEIEAEIISNVTKITDKLDAVAVKALFEATAADGAYPVTVSIVSDDVNYSAMEDIEGFVGTNATVTFYAEIDSVKIPVATVKLVVLGDVNGDGVVDVMDAATAQLVSVEHAQLEGCYLIAGDITGDALVVGDDDYGQIVNKAIA